MYTAAWLINTLKKYTNTDIRPTHTNARAPSTGLAELAHGSFLEYRIIGKEGGAPQIPQPEDLKTLEWANLCYDSRIANSSSLFACLTGRYTRGEEYLDDAVVKGAAIVLVSKDFFVSVSDSLAQKTLALPTQGEKYLIVAVESVEKSLVGITREIRQDYGRQTHCIAISGSNGKTTSTRLIQAMLSTRYSVTGSSQNYNSIQGLAKSIVDADWSSDYGVFECGIDRKGEMDLLMTMLDPDEALLTNLGKAHLGNFNSHEELIEEKLGLGAYLSDTQFFWLPEKYEKNSDLALNRGAKTSLRSSLRWHGPRHADFIEADHSHPDYSLIYLSETKIKSALRGASGVYMFLSAYCIACAHGIAISDIVRVMEKFEAVKGRGNIISKEPLVFDYSYNANPESVHAALAWFGELEGFVKILILGGMKELGNQTEQLHEKTIELVRSMNFEQVCFVGQEYIRCPSMQKKLPNWHVARDVSELLRCLPRLSQILNSPPEQRLKVKDYNLKKTAVLLIGSRYYQLETAVSSS